ncbi:MAG: barstar family protein [Planctomycetales bacterium]|nr:barstar family protein [Planctomycetales bacterium]
MSGDAANTFVANIPASVRSKQKLLRILADQLQFPAYFGNNWDALEECLRDLSWLPAGNIEIHHRDIPLPPGSQDRRTYLQILRSASTFWANSNLRRLECVFPAHCQAEVLSLRA